MNRKAVKPQRGDRPHTTLNANLGKLIAKRVIGTRSTTEKQSKLGEIVDVTLSST